MAESAGETTSPEPAGAAAVRRIEGDAIVRWIGRPGIRGYRYRANASASWFLVLSSLSCAALAVLLWMRSELSGLIHQVGFAILCGYALWSFWSAAHWNLFAARNYVGVSEDELLVGRGSRAWLVPRSRLSRETIELEAMQRGAMTSVLPLRVGPYRANVHLVGPFASMQNVQQFIAEVLESLMETDAGGA